MKKFWYAALSVLISFYFLTPQAFAKHHHHDAPPQAQNAVSSQAGDSKLSRFKKHLDDYGKSCGDKIDFGVPNFLMGWTLIISEPVTHYKKTESRWKDTMGILASAGKGLLLFPIDTAGGALNAATFFIPGKIPLPKNGVNTDQLIGDTDHLQSNACAVPATTEQEEGKSSLKV